MGQSSTRRVAVAPEPQAPHPQVLFRLLKLSNLVTRPFFANFSVREELSLNDLRVVMTLGAMREAAAHEIAEAAGLHPMNVSRSVAALRRQGRLIEQRDPANRRRKILSLSAEGQGLHRRLIPHVRKISDFVFSALTPEEEATFSHLLDQLTARLERVDPASPLLIESGMIEAESGEPSKARRSGDAD